MLSEREENLLNLTREVANKFTELEVLHPDDAADFFEHIRALQNIIMARPEMRKNNYLKVEEPKGHFEFYPEREDDPKE